MTAGMLFWDVDTQVDFLLPYGHLYVPGSESILPILARLTRYAADQGFPLISSVCAHRPEDPELKIYGAHCMAGTPGARKVPQTILPRRWVIPNHAIKLPRVTAFQQIIIEKQAFDPFTNPNTDEVLGQFGSALRIVLYGVVTEICVAVTARRLLERGHRVELLGDAIFPLDFAKADDSVQELEHRGGKVTSSDEILESGYDIAA